MSLSQHKNFLLTSVVFVEEQPVGIRGKIDSSRVSTVTSTTSYREHCCTTNCKTENEKIINLLFRWREEGIIAKWAVLLAIVDPCYNQTIPFTFRLTLKFQDAKGQPKTVKCQLAVIWPCLLTIITTLIKWAWALSS